MVPSETGITTEIGLHRLYRHMNSIGRYGDTAFLCCKYGSGELAQAFCRMCAVWGGTYILRRSIQEIITVTDNDTVGRIDGIVDTAGCSIKCSSLICNIGYLSEIFTIRGALYTVIITCTTQMVSVERGLVVVPPGSDDLQNNAAIFILQSDSALSVVPEGVYVYHLLMEVPVPTLMHTRVAWKEYVESNECTACTSTLHKVADKLLRKQGTPHLSLNGTKLFTGAKNTDDISRTITVKPIFQCDEHNNESSIRGVAVPAGMYVTGDTMWDVHMDDIIAQAKSVFHKICPNNEFFPVNECDNEDAEDDVVETQLRATLETLTGTSDANGKQEGVETHS